MFRRGLQLVRAGLGTVSALGWALTGLGALAWICGYALAWAELRIIALAVVVLWVMAIAFTVGGLDLEATVAVAPSRVVVGNRAVGELRIRNRRKRAMRNLLVEFPVGDQKAPFGFARIRGGEEVDEQFIVPTQRRAVIPVGPVTTVQGDPLGMLRRAQVWSEVDEIYVHPLTVRAGAISAGLIRDMEGQATNQLSPSDVAFHTLRDYVPGDDPRHVHWKSTAKLDKLQVRQYVDTRRSHVAVVLSTSADDYSNPEEFELAVSCAASIAAQSLLEEQTISVFAGVESLPAPSNKALLDRWSGVELQAFGGGVVDCTKVVRRRAADASVVVLCTGSIHDARQLQAAARFLPRSAAVVVLRSDCAGPARFQRAGSSVFLTITSLDGLRAGVATLAAS